MALNDNKTKSRDDGLPFWRHFSRLFVIIGCVLLWFGKYLWKISKEELIKMGRKGPKLVPFLLDGLKTKKYRNLMFENSSRLIFSLCLPHKTNKLDKRDEYIFKDWYQKNNKKYGFSKHYTVARQAMTASLRKSDYVEKILIGDSKMTYRILTSDEVKGISFPY
ncbi:uncharacterized protein CEXT_714461 [Caerostris extrusa]|uniref:LAGLIDADG homing endonuclease n=1 Tax=Caerostris extrusa TaxID=172846 RepID=A0AAV4YGG1_CAEEX|nr:uncharacterized protein CEXT_714461 [Caerostris extrusa]